MAAVGAFGSGEASFPRRAVYWVTTIVLGAVIGSGFGALFRNRGWLEERPWLRGALITLLMTPPMTLAVWGLTHVVFGPLAEFGSPWAFVPAVFAVSAVMTAIIETAKHTPVQTHAAPPGAPPPRFLERLPPKLRGAELYALEAEDHYLRLHTSRGSSELILMRLADAVAELEGVEGARTHRSWWVARSAVEAARRGDGRAVLRLRNGVDSPVSRTYARALRDAGWY